MSETGDVLKKDAGKVRYELTLILEGMSVGLGLSGLGLALMVLLNHR